MIDYEAQYKAERDEAVWLGAWVDREMDALGVRTKKGRRLLLTEAVALLPAVQDEETGREVPDIRGLYASANRHMRRQWLK